MSKRSDEAPGHAGARRRAGGRPNPKERRLGIERRAGTDRRVLPHRRRQDLGPPKGPDRERRTGLERRLPGDRRSPGGPPEGLVGPLSWTGLHTIPRRPPLEHQAPVGAPEQPGW